MSTTDEQRLREADSWFAAFENDKVWDQATARACFIAGHVLGHQAAQQAPTPAVAWRVHRRPLGEALYPVETAGGGQWDGPALFQSHRSAVSWMHEQIDFKGWKGAWIEPLGVIGAAPAPSAAESSESAAPAGEKS